MDRWPTVISVYGRWSNSRGNGEAIIAKLK
jgi:hypothetical protein